MPQPLLVRPRVGHPSFVGQQARQWLLLLLAVLGSAASALAQTTVTIGSTTIPAAAPATSDYYFGPIYRSSASSTFNYSRYAHLYTAAELGIPGGATITQLEWLKADAGAVTGANTFNVLLGNTTAATLATGSTWATLTAGATSAYSNTAQTVTGAAGTYLTVPTTGFTYTGGNLLVLSDWTKGGTATGVVNFITNPATGLALGTAAATALTTTTTLAAATYGDRRPTLRITYTGGTACTAPPTAGTATASATSVCAGSTVSLSLSGVAAAVGLTVQWQSSATGAAGSYTNIAGATSLGYTTPALSQTTYYQAVVTCSGQSATSVPVQVTVLAPTYATLPYTQGFENTWVSRCNTNDVPDASWLNTPAAGNNSWRREDDGASAGWSSVSLGAYSPAGSNAGGASSSHSARFHNYSATSGSVGTLDLYLNIGGGTGTPTLQFDYRNAESNTVTVLLSTDGGATFPTTLQTLGTQAAWTSYLLSLPTTATATTVVRFRATSNFGSSDNGLDNVRVSYVSCAQPTALAATTTAAGATVSASVTFVPAVGATSYTLGLSPAVAGAPTTVSASPFTLTGLAYSTTYTLTLTTNCGSSTSQTATTTFTTPCAPPTYATLPYSQGFETSWLSRCGTSDVPDNSWANTPVTGNNSWRRNDDATSANWGSANGAYTPGGSNVNGASSTYSARFHSYNATSGQQGNFDYYVDLSAAGTKRLVFDYINTSGTDKLSVFLSTDGGATFGTTALTQQAVAATWTQVTVDFTATSATSVLRFQATSDFGSTDIGLDNVSVLVAPAVDVQPTALVAPAASTTASCYSSTEAVTVTVRNAGASALDFAANPLTLTVAVTGAVTQTLTTTVNTNAANGGTPLAVGATVNITLPTTLDMTTVGTYSLVATATATGDGNPANDVLGTQTRTVAAPVAGTLSPATAFICVSGTATLTLTGAANGSIQYQSSTSATGTFTDIAGATSATYTTPVLTTTTYYRAQVRCNTGTATSNVSAITVNNPLVASTNTPVSVCAGSPATLTATGSAGTTLRFFETATGGTPLATGGTFTTPSLTTSRQYFVEATTSSPENAGRTAPATTSNTTAINYGLVFTANSAFVLTSLDVYPAGSAGNLVVQVQDNTGTLIPGLTATVAVPAGTGTTAFTVPLNFSVPAGTGLRLIATSSPALVREGSLGGFPYNSPNGTVSITNGYISGTSTTYYFFYNWQLATTCASATRTAIQVNVTQPATATFSYPATGSNCAGSTGTVAATLATGATAGTFSSTTGLTLDATTGTVNLATSTAGTYTVTNTVAASGSCGAVTATATLTVNPTPARPTLTPTYNGTVTTLTSSAATGNQFYFNGAAIAGATGQTYVVNGSATTYGSYTVVVTNSFGCSSPPSVATVVTTTRAGIAGASLLVYPNPTPTGQVTLELSGFRSATQLAVIDALGRVVRSETLPATAGVVTHQLNLSGMASGVYMLRLTNADGIETRRLVRE
jgi:hypothetical protein